MNTLVLTTCADNDCALDNQAQDCSMQSESRSALSLYFAAGAGTPGTTEGAAAPGTAGTPGTAFAGAVGAAPLGATGATPGTADPGAGAAGAV